MTVAALRKPSFSALSFHKETGGKITPAPVLTEPGDIGRRWADVTSGGPWSHSPQAIGCQELLNAVCQISMENAAATARPAVTRAEVEYHLAGQPGGVSGCADIDILFEDGLIGVDADGCLVVVDRPARFRPDAGVKYPGWSRPDSEARGLPRLTRDERESLIRSWYARLIAGDLPIAIGAKARAAFASEQARGAVCLPWRAWAALLNTEMPEGRHPVTARTAGNWITAMLEAGDMVMCRKPRQLFDQGRWRTISGAYRLTRERSSACAEAFREWREKRRRMRAEREAERATSSETRAWRELRVRWRERDRTAGRAVE